MLSEPRLGFEGSATSLSSREQQVRVMLDALYLRLASVTGREVDEIRADARRGRYLTVDDAISYGLIQGPAGPTSMPSSTPGRMPGRRTERPTRKTERGGVTRPLP
jgi:hypothetical protein